MRLGNKKRGSLVGPVSCLGLVGVLALGMVCPQFSKTFAEEVPIAYSEDALRGLSVESVKIDEENPEMATMVLTSDGQGVRTVAEARAVLEPLMEGEFTVTLVEPAPVEDFDDPVAGAPVEEAPAEDVLPVVEEPAEGVVSADEGSEPVVGVTPAQVAAALAVPAGTPMAIDDPAPVTTPPSNATITFIVSGPARAITRTKNLMITFNVSEFLELKLVNDGTASDATDFTMNMGTVNPGSSVSAQQKFMVRGNNANGFGVYVKANTDADLKTTSGAYIRALTNADGSVSYSGLSNAWGYNVSALSSTSESLPAANTLSYVGVTTAGTKLSTSVASSEAPSNGKYFALTTAANAGAAAAAGTYETQITVSAVAPFTASL